MAVWDPSTYLRFGSERARPFFDLLSPGRLPRTAVRRRPGLRPGQPDRSARRALATREVLGVDNSPEMIEAARARGRRPGAAAGDRPAAVLHWPTSGPGGRPARWT